MDLLKALESFDDTPTDVAEPAPSPVATSPVPGIAPDVFVAAPKVALSDEDKAQILMFMLKKELGVERFCELINGYATDLEVYGLIDSAEKAKINTQCLAKSHHEEKCKRPVVMAAIKAAVAAGTESAKAYLEAEEAEHKAIAAIMNEFGEDAKSAVHCMLIENIRRAMAMNGPYAKSLQSHLSEMADRFK